MNSYQRTALSALLSGVVAGTAVGVYSYYQRGRRGQELAQDIIIYGTLLTVGGNVLYMVMAETEDSYVQQAEAALPNSPLMALFNPEGLGKAGFAITKLLSSANLADMHRMFRKGSKKGVTFDETPKNLYTIDQPRE